MTPEEFARRMQEIDSGDPETSHREADELMARVLRELGYGAGVDVFDNMSRWYA